MPVFPKQPTDVFEIAGRFLGENPQPANGFVAANAPSVSGYGTRQSRIQNERPAVSRRKLMHWLVPEGPIVQMYVNPQSVRYNYKKVINPQRTKGGFAVQYWGEDLIPLSIQGTTGTSGIEGINVLYDIYRNEQLAFDPYALLVSAKKEQETFSSDLSTIGTDVFGLPSNPEGFGGIASDFISTLTGSAQQFSNIPRNAPSLAALACTVELYWSGEVYRGFFTSFSVTESAQELGLFNYDIEFIATQKRGFRQNFMPWHRSATSGPSNSSPEFGTPHSFGSLVSSEQGFPTPQTSGNNSDILEDIEDIIDF